MFDHGRVLGFRDLGRLGLRGRAHPIEFLLGLLDDLADRSDRGFVEIDPEPEVLRLLPDRLGPVEELPPGS